MDTKIATVPLDKSPAKLHEHSWMWVESANPNKGSGCLLALAGVMLTPLLIGIPILIYGMRMSNEVFGFWRCKTCGQIVYEE